MPVENIEGDGGMERTAQRQRLAEQVRRRSLFAWFIPNTPLVNDLASGLYPRDVSRNAQPEPDVQVPYNPYVEGAPSPFMAFPKP